MLQFFRKYQRFFFIFTTVIIVISFSFFGTYSALDPSSTQDRVAFVAVDGSTIHASELESMAMFLNSDQAAYKALGTVWGANFLNDGVVSSDFLKSGLIDALYASYGSELSDDLKQRLHKEKYASFYAHPQASFVSAEGAWGYFAPAVAEGIAALRSADDATSNEAFKARIALLLAEQEFPPSALRQILQFQQQQYSWLQADPNLGRTDLSLFGYHTVEDWFGPRFLRLVSEFIINSAKIAEKNGYKVTMAEAKADLLHQAEATYKLLPTSASARTGRPAAFMREQLRRMGLDESRAVKIWQQVLLFRRLFNGVGDAVFVDPLMFSQYSDYALQTAEGTLYQLPSALRLADFRALQKFQIYLAALTGRPATSADLELPTKVLDVDAIVAKYPSLAQKRYVVDVAEADKRSLQARVGVKQTWDWQVQDVNWNSLKEEFPELGTSKAADSESRFAALDALDATTRQRVDAFARASIVDEHPEWIDAALKDAAREQKEISVRQEGGLFPFLGVEDRNAVIALLDGVALSQDEATPSQREAYNKLYKFSGDDEHYYSIIVVERTPTWEILTFEQALDDEALDKQVIAALEPFYVKLRQADPQPYRKEDQSWKSLEEVRDLVAVEFFKPLLQAIETEHRRGENSDSLDPRQAAQHRFLKHMRSALSAIQQDTSAEKLWLYQTSSSSPSLLKQHPSLTNQWLLSKSTHSVGRSDDRSNLDPESIFALEDQDWTAVGAGRGGDLWFFQLSKKGPASGKVVASQQMARVRELLAVDARKLMANHVLDKIRDKGAIDLSYLVRDRDGQRSDEEGADATQGTTP